MIQVPGASAAFVEDAGTLSKSGREFVSNVANALNTPKTTTTAGRPTSGVKRGELWYDTTIDRPIWVKTVSPVTWIYADGTPA